MSFGWTGPKTGLSPAASPETSIDDDGAAEEGAAKSTSWTSVVSSKVEGIFLGIFCGFLEEKKKRRKFRFFPQP